MIAASLQDFTILEELSFLSLVTDRSAQHCSTDIRHRYSARDIDKGTASTGFQSPELHVFFFFFQQGKEAVGFPAG